MKLHLGCGKRRLDGYMNIDLADSDMNCDIRHLPFDDNSVDEIIAIHVFEHFYLFESSRVLREWKRVLKPDGLLILELPCFEKVIEHIENGAPDNLTRWAMFGDPTTHSDGEPALHKWLWYSAELVDLMTRIGFSSAACSEPVFHRKDRDMRVVAVK